MNDINYERGTDKNGWVWSDGTEYEYFNWDQEYAEPNQGDGMVNEDCVEILTSNGGWNDAQCSIDWNHALCNIPKDTQLSMDVMDCITEPPSLYILAQSQPMMRANPPSVSTTPPSHNSDSVSLPSYLMLLFMFVGIFTVLICFIAGVYMCRMHQRSKDIQNKMISKTMHINKPMTIVIGIGEYEEYPFSPEIHGVVENLPSIRIDIRNILRLFKDKLGYNIFPNYKYEHENSFRLNWTQDELIEFLKEKSIELENNLRQDNSFDKFDGLIVMLSCHGIDNHYILTSDYKKISKTAIHRIFSAKKPLSRKIPRIFVFDCCSGRNDRNSTIRIIGSVYEMDKTAMVNKSKIINVDHIHRSSSLIWARNEDNPDYKLVIVNAANEGFQSKINTRNGSYVIAKFTEKLGENIKNNDFFLHEILDDVQEELHDIMGKQLMSKTFYNRTEYIKFEKNMNGLIADKIDGDEGKPFARGNDVCKDKGKNKTIKANWSPLTESERTTTTINDHWKNVTNPHSLQLQMSLH